jgi:hypothetical protein
MIRLREFDNLLFKDEDFRINDNVSVKIENAGEEDEEAYGQIDKIYGVKYFQTWIPLVQIKW